MILVFVVVVLAAVVAIAMLVGRNRPDQSIESGISSFQREMDALAPPDHEFIPPYRPADQPESPGEPDQPPPPEDDERRSAGDEG